MVLKITQNVFRSKPLLATDIWRAVEGRKNLEALTVL
jgi:hypothetical protein